MRIWKANLSNWEQPYGGKKGKMFHRPLIPVFLCFTGGILFSHLALLSTQGLLLPIFLSIIILLFATLLLPSRLSLLCLLGTFFFLGIFLYLQEQKSSQLFPIAKQRKNVTIEGTVLDPQRKIKETARIKVRAQALFFEKKRKRVNENLLVSVYSNYPPFEPGERIRFPARLRPFKNFNNPGRYDYETAMKIRGYSCGASVSDGRHIVPMGRGHLPLSRRLVETVQRPVRKFFKEKLDDGTCALFRALILGERQGISPELREPFNRTGLGHVLAVSGLHIGLVAWVSFFLFKGLLSLSYRTALSTDVRKLAALLTSIPVIGYTYLAGFQVSSQRAMIMVLAFLWSLILGREKEVWSTLALAGLLILAIDPLAVLSISFQLSFIAVIGILWLTPAILKKIPFPTGKDHGRVPIFYHLFAYSVGLICVSLSAVIFLLPITTYYFHRISLVCIPANLTAVPIMGLWIIPLGLLSVLSLSFLPQVSAFIIELAAWGLHVMMEMVRFWSNLNWSFFWVVTPNIFEIFMFYLLLFFGFFCKGRQWAKIGVMLMGVIIFADIGYWTYKVRLNNEMKVHFIDVGQANSALIEFPGGKRMLIDGGGFPRDNFDVGEMVVAPYLWHLKINHIDYLALSHPQSDHMNGLRFIAKAFHPREFWYNGDLVETLSFKELIGIVESRRIKKLLPDDLSEGREINGVKIEVLHPLGGGKCRISHDNGTGLNNNSLVLKISYAGKSFLFPGDLEREGETVLISDAGHAIKSDILLSPHHGSQSSSTREFLRRVRPDICVISSGEGNHFGFPHERTLERLSEIGCRVIRIDRAGAVKCTVGTDRFEIKTFLKQGNRQ
jgi:competence protein ComEC